jgi:hypothetical protein
VSITLQFCTSYRSASRHYSVPFPISSVKQTCQWFAQLISTLQHRSRLTTMALFSKISNFFLTIYILSWDALLSVLNFILPNKKIGHIVPPGHPGEGGKWGEYIAPKEGDSRCSCPAMNAMANHGKSIKLCPLCGVIFTRVSWYHRHPTKRWQEYLFQGNVSHRPCYVQLRTYILPLRTELHSRDTWQIVLERYPRSRRNR